MRMLFPLDDCAGWLFLRRSPDEFCLGRHTLAPSRTLSPFRAIYALQPNPANGVLWSALEGLATAKDPRDPSLANAFSARFYTEARHARSAPVPSEESTMSTERNGRTRYGNGSMKWQCNAWHGW